MRRESFFSPRRVFIDTSAHFALANPSDAGHVAAQTISAQLISERRQIFTTYFVVAETHALVLTRLGRVVARGVLDAIDRGTATVVRVSARDERRAREIIFRYDDKDFSFTDATSFAVMERLHMRDVFSFDSDFEQYGFRVLRP